MTTMIRDNIRTYSELITIPTYLERFRYLRLDGKVGADTFGCDRYLNQQFYKTDEWKAIRGEVIVRDLGNDLGIEDYPIAGRIIVHHMNPITKEDILNRSEFLLNPEYLISTAHITHEAITYGDESLLIAEPITRKANDTCPWKH